MIWSTQELSEHLKGFCKGHPESPAHSARVVPQNPLGQWKGLETGHPLKGGQETLHIPSSHLVWPDLQVGNLLSSVQYF